MNWDTPFLCLKIICVDLVRVIVLCVHCLLPFFCFYNLIYHPNTVIYIDKTFFDERNTWKHVRWESRFQGYLWLIVYLLYRNKITTYVRIYFRLQIVKIISCCSNESTHDVWLLFLTRMKVHQIYNEHVFSLCLEFLSNI